MILDATNVCIDLHRNGSAGVIIVLIASQHIMFVLVNIQLDCSKACKTTFTDLRVNHWINHVAGYF